MFAQYGPTEPWGKWSPSDDLIYLGRTDIADAVIALPDGGNEVSMLAPLALLGGGGLVAVVWVLVLRQLRPVLLVLRHLVQVAVVLQLHMSYRQQQILHRHQLLADRAMRTP